MKQCLISIFFKKKIRSQLQLSRKESINFDDYVPRLFIMTNESDRKLLDNVRESFLTEFRGELRVYFLHDFYEISTSGCTEQCGTVNDFLQEQWINAMLLEMQVACLAQEFLAYGNGLYEGSFSVPSLMVHQMRLHTCGTTPSHGLFAPLVEKHQRY